MYSKNIVLSRLSVNGITGHAERWMGSGELIVLREARPRLLGGYKQDSYMGWELDKVIAQAQGPLILYYLLLSYCFNYVYLSWYICTLHADLLLSIEYSCH